MQFKVACDGLSKVQMAKSWDKAQLSWFSKNKVHPIASTCSLKCQKKSKEPVHKKWSLDQYRSLQKYFLYFVKRTPDTLWQLWDGGMGCPGMWYVSMIPMVWYEVTWYWKERDMVWGLHPKIPWDWYEAHIHPGMGTLKVP